MSRDGDDTILKTSATGRSCWRGPWTAQQDGRAGGLGGGALGCRARHAFAGRGCFHSEAIPGRDEAWRRGASTMTLRCSACCRNYWHRVFETLLPTSPACALRNRVLHVYSSPPLPIVLRTATTHHTTLHYTTLHLHPATPRPLAVPSTRSAFGTRRRPRATTADHHAQHSLCAVASYLARPSAALTRRGDPQSHCARTPARLFVASYGSIACPAAVLPQPTPATQPPRQTPCNPEILARTEKLQGQ
jgi:hypothetical protein